MESCILRPGLLVAQHRRHHPRRRRAERSPEIEAGLEPGRTLNRGVSQRPMNFVQRDRQAAAGIYPNRQGKFR